MSEDKHVHDRIKIAVMGSGGAPAVARALGKKPSTVQNWMAGQAAPPLETFIELSNATGVNMNWLATGLGAMTIDASTVEATNSATILKSPMLAAAGIKRPALPDHVAVPRLAIELSAGAGAVPDIETAGEGVMFARTWLQRVTTGAQNCHVVTVSGDSMVPTLHSRDSVLIDTGAARFAGDGIYALRDEDVVLIKRLVALGGGRVRVTSDNPEFPSWETLIGDIVIIGRVRWLGRGIG
jgi:phage repressor protein C with HTH and peptisase S24 domain